MIQTIVSATPAQRNGAEIALWVLRRRSRIFCGSRSTNDDLSAKQIEFRNGTAGFRGIGSGAPRCGQRKIQVSTASSSSPGRGQDESETSRNRRRASGRLGFCDAQARKTCTRRTKDPIPAR